MILNPEGGKIFWCPSNIFSMRIIIVLDNASELDDFQVLNKSYINLDQWETDEAKKDVIGIGEGKVFFSANMINYSDLPNNTFLFISNLSVVGVKKKLLSDYQNLINIVLLPSDGSLESYSDLCSEFIAQLKYMLRTNYRQKLTKICETSELRKYLRTDGSKPRQVYYDKGKYFTDYTPWCVYSNWVCNDINFSFNTNEFFSNYVKENGIFIPVRKFEKEVNNRLLARQDEIKSLLISRFFKSRPRQQIKVVPAFLLPLQGVTYDGRTNLTGLDWLVWGTPTFDVFLRHVVYYLCSHCKDEVTLNQYLQLLTNYSLTVGTCLEVAFMPDYEVELNEEENQCLKFASKVNNVYFSYIESKMLKLIDLLPRETSAKLNLPRSAGLDLVLDDGDLFKVKDSYELPNLLFDSADNSKNAWVSKNYYPLKVEKLSKLRKIKRIRYNGLIDRKMDDPDWHIDMLLQGCAYINTVAYRINGNDQLKVVANVDASSFIWQVELRPLTLQDDFKSLILNGDLSNFSGKPREFTAAKDINGFSYIFLSPFQFVYYMHALSDITGLDTEVNFKYPGNRLRGIYPGFFSLNIADGCISRFYTYALEKCEIGFPNPDLNSNYAKFCLRQKSTYCLPLAMDTSHFETWFSSNKWIMLLFGDVGTARYEIFRDRCRGFITTKAGLKFHDQQTSSGISDTTFHNILASAFTSTVTLAKMCKNFIMTFKKLYLYIFSVAINFLSEMVDGIKRSFELLNPVSEGLDFSDSICDTEYGSVWFEHYFGTDDQLKKIRSNTVTTSQLVDLTNSKVVQEWLSRCKINIELGESAHFGIVITANGFRRNVHGAAEKLFSNEKRFFGDRLCASYLQLFEEDPLVKEAIQFGLDAIKGGSVKAYELGAQAAVLTLNTIPEYTTNLLDGMNIDYSPTARLLSTQLKASGFNVVESKKLPKELIINLVRDYLLFLERFTTRIHFEV